MRFKKTVIALLCLSFLFMTAVNPGDNMSEVKVSAATTSEYQDKISDLEEQRKQIESEISDLKSDKKDQKKLSNALEQKIDNLQTQINVCNNQLTECEKQIAELEQNIVDKNNELAEAKFAFKQRLRAIYMSGGMETSNLMLLLSSDNLAELLNKTELAKCVSAYDRALAQKIKNDIDDIESSKAKIDELKAEQEAVKADLTGKKKELNQEVSVIDASIDKISSKIGSKESQIKAIDKAVAEYEAAIKAAQSIGKDQVYDGKFTWPIPGYYTVTSPYGYRYHPITGVYKFHKGTDISGGNIKGKPIVAMADGVVSIASYNSGGYGNYVMVNHGTGSDGKSYVTLYAHMTKYCVSVGQSVKRGQTIGYVGTTGASTGYHLHFEVRVDGNTTNPMSYF